MSRLTTLDIITRLILAILFGGVIGYERQYKNRPAGIRTHILVCLGSVIIALIQMEITVFTFKIAKNDPEMIGVLSTDQARLIAQIVSGIGFLGAGTIIVTKRNVTGLTTAASLWASAGLGISVGMGYYKISLLSFLAIIFSLTIINKIIKVPKLKKLEIKYFHRVETKEFLNNYFEKHNIEIEDVVFDVQIVDNEKIYKNIFTIDLPRLLTYADVIEELSMYPNVIEIRMVAMAD